MKNVQDIRKIFLDKYKREEFVFDKTGRKSAGTTVEIVNASFIADEPMIFGLENNEYVNKELNWYLSQSLNVNDIEGETPWIWKACATPEGFINSNYGWCIYSPENGNQYNNCINELKNNNLSRRASMIYNRPSMWEDYNKDGKNDFICTYSVSCFIRDNKLIYCVYMRSNDAWAGYRNDYAWHKYVANNM
ncbi:MAG: thymidylate synthase, partial [Clostridia bacterium]